MNVWALLELFAAYLVALSLVVVSLVAAHSPVPSARIARDRLAVDLGRGYVRRDDMSVFDRYFRDLKVQSMFGSAAVAAYSMFQFATGNGVPQRISMIAAGIAGISAAALYFINPKTRDWLPAGSDLNSIVRDLVAETLTGKAPAPVDPRAARIAALEAQLDALRGQ